MHIWGIHKAEEDKHQTDRHQTHRGVYRVGPQLKNMNPKHFVENPKAEEIGPKV